MYVNGCLVWYADGWWGLHLKAGEWLETVRQPELICSAHRVIDAEIVYMRRSQSFSLCMHFCARLCVFPYSLFREYIYYVHMYAFVRALVCLFFLCVRLHISGAGLSQGLSPSSSGSRHPDSSFAVLPASLAPHLSIHLAEGFTLLTVKFTHIHNYVFNQSHLKASRMQPFFGNGRRSKSTLKGLSGLIPVSARCTNHWQIFRDGSSRVREAFNLQSGTLGLHAPQHVDPLANQYDCRYWIIHGCLMMCQSQMVFVLFIAHYAQVCASSKLYCKLILHEDC